MSARSGSSAPAADGSLPHSFVGPSRDTVAPTRGVPLRTWRKSGRIRVARGGSSPRRAEGKGIASPLVSAGETATGKAEPTGHGPAVRIPVPRRAAFRFVPFQEDVGVRAGPPEAASPRPAGAGPNGLATPIRSPGHPQGNPIQSICGLAIMEVQVFRDRPPPHGQYGLDHSRHARRRLQVADVGLHRADQDRAVRFAPGAVGGRRRARLYGGPPTSVPVPCAST